MDGVGPGGAREVDQLLAVHVGLGEGVAAERVGLAGRASERGGRIGVRVADHGVDAELRGRSDNPQGDLRAVGDEDLHCGPFFCELCSMNMATSWG